MNKNKIVAILALFAGVLTVVNAQDTIDNLKDAVSLAIENHPQVMKGKAERDSTIELRQEAKSGYLPTLELRSAGGYENSQTESIENEGDHYRSLGRNENSLSLRQMIWDGDETKSRVSRQNALLKRADHSIRDNQESVALRVSQSYLDVMKSNEKVIIAAENVESHRVILKTVEDRFKQKLGREADITQVKGRLALALAQLKREEATSKASIARFEEAVNKKPGKLKKAPSLIKQLPKKLSEAKEMAMILHPALKAQTEGIEAQKAAVTEAESRFQPKLFLESTASENENIGGNRGNEDHFTALLVLTYNIYRGGGDAANLRGQKAALKQQGAEYKELQLAIIRDLAVSWYNREGTIVELEYFIQHEEASKKTLEAYNAQYKLGQRTLFDLLNARSELFRSKTTVVDTRYANILGIHQILANIGILSKNLAK
ncbi:MAG: TolC family outer membrane protein [Lentisphaeria bacterium]|nr:TolC family outer membrane protein [Lentisphaeria bacterium]NQZ68540.1 TolC family outer membrane protein [Lentisphaeria bacterium]